MSSSGGSSAKTLVDNAVGGIGNEWEQFRQDPMGFFVKNNSQMLTGSFSKYNLRSGRWEDGYGPRGLNESLGELTGKNAARKAGMEAQDKLNAEKAAAAEDQKQRQLQAYRADVSSSNSAAAINASGVQKNLDRTSQYVPDASLGSNQRDFLGL